MQLAIKGNSSNKFFQISYNFLEDTVNPLCYNLLTWDIIFNYFLKSWWQSLMTALCTEGVSLMLVHSHPTVLKPLAGIYKSRRNIWGVMDSACLILSILSQISTFFCWVKRVVFTLCMSELQSKKKACYSTWSITITMPIQSKLWSKLQCQWSIADLHSILEEERKTILKGEHNTWIWRA